MPQGETHRMREGWFPESFIDQEYLRKMDCDPVTRWDAGIWFTSPAPVAYQRATAPWLNYWFHHDRDHSPEPRRLVSPHLHSTSVHPRNKLTITSRRCCLQLTLRMEPTISCRWPLRNPVATPRVTTGAGHEEIFSTSFSLAPSCITPGRGGS